MGAGGALLDGNFGLPLLFCVGVAIGMAKKSDGSTALAAVAGYLVFFGILTRFPKECPQGATFTQLGQLAGACTLKDGTATLAEFQTPGVFGGIVMGLLRGVWRELYGEEPEDVPAYTADWAEGSPAQTLRDGLARHLRAIPPAAMAPADVALFRMGRGGPARHCGIVGERSSGLTLIHACQGRRVREETFSPLWRRRLAFVFRIPS